MRDGDRRERAVPDLLHHADDPRDDRGEELRDLHGDDRGDVGGREDLGEAIGEHVDHDEGFRARVGELLRHLGCRVERVGVHQDAPGLENPERDDRIAEAVRHLHGDPVALGEADHLAEVRGEVVGEGVDLGVAERAVHAVGHALGERGGRGVFGRGVSDHRRDAVECEGAEIGRDALRIVLEPGS
nr:hypothetical protein [Microbacterium aurantiacum]